MPAKKNSLKEALKAKSLSRKELILVVARVQALLWLDQDKRGDFWNPDKDWDSDTIEEVARALDASGLRPERNERA